MNDLKERLEEHARWLEEAGESKVRAHVSPETCKQAAEDIREAVKGIDEQDKQGRNMKLIDVTKLNEKWQTLIGADPAELYLFDEDKPTKIEYIPPRYSWLDIVPRTTRERRHASRYDNILRAHGYVPKD